MTLVRKLVIIAGLAWAALMSSCNPALAAGEHAGYVLQLDDGVVLFDTTPCPAGAVLVPVPPSIQLKGATAIANGPEKQRIELCWFQDGETIVIVGPQGPVFNINVRDSRVTKRNNI